MLSYRLDNYIWEAWPRERVDDIIIIYRCLVGDCNTYHGSDNGHEDFAGGRVADDLGEEGRDETDDGHHEPAGQLSQYGKLLTDPLRQSGYL